jgi:hypothetical protein
MMVTLLVFLIAVLAGLLFGANLPPLAMLVAGAAIAFVFSLGAFATARRKSPVGSRY